MWRSVAPVNRVVSLFELFEEIALRNTSLIILISLFFGISIYAGNQKITLNKNGVIFSLELVSEDTVSYDGTITVKYEIINKSKNSVVVLDTDIPGKKSPQIMRVVDFLTIELELGGHYLQTSGMFRKLRLIKKGEKISNIFSIPVSEYLQSYYQNDLHNKIRYPYIKNVHIAAYIAYSNSRFLIKNALIELTKLDDYLAGNYNPKINHGPLEDVLESFMLSGITITVNLPSEE